MRRGHASIDAEYRARILETRGQLAPLPEPAQRGWGFAMQTGRACISMGRPIRWTAPVAWVRDGLHYADSVVQRSWAGRQMRDIGRTITRLLDVGMLRCSDHSPGCPRRSETPRSLRARRA